MDDNLKANDAVAAGLVMANGSGESVEAHGFYVVECVKADGTIRWTDTIDNLITTVGKNDKLDKYLSGAAYTAAPVMGLKGAGVPVVGDTQASHASWSEVGATNAPTYTGPRKVPAFSAAASGTKATSAAVSFSITSTGTVAGCFINMGGATAIDSTSGVLYSVGDFTGGSRAVQNSDVLNVSYQSSLT